MTELDPRIQPILELIRDEALRSKVLKLFNIINSEPREYGSILDDLLNNFAFAVPTAWHWHNMTENPDATCRYRKKGEKITNAQHIQEVNTILAEHKIDPRCFEYNRYRARNWEEVRWIDFKIFCILLDRGYDMSELQG
jgi:hypothetical protein